MTVSRMISLAEDLERYLGDPHDSSSGMSFQRILELDEREEYPDELVDLVHRWGVHKYCLPEQWGGHAGDVEVGFNLLRLVARRDPTTAAALAISNIAYMPAWITGTDEQRAALVHAINQGTKIAWGLSERAHGSDVLANEMCAEKVDGGYLLTGEKYLIGNATVADVVIVHARTGERGGPGSWSLFSVDKRQCRTGSITELPKERLHGVRALDVSGIRLDRLYVPESTRFGAEGTGLEVALQTTQVARAVITAVVLGAADTALRVTMDFAEQREIFGQKVTEIPYSRRQLAECFADLLLAEAVSTAATRGLQANPAQTSVYSSIAKYFVPTLLDRTIGQLSVVLGARNYLRSNPHFGIFQKMLRDASVAIFVDGNTVVNLKNIALQLSELLGTRQKRDQRSDTVQRVHATHNVDVELPRWQPDLQQLFSRGKDDTVLALPEGVERLRAMAKQHPDDEQGKWYLRAADVAEKLDAELDRLHAEAQRLRKELGKAYGSSAELFRLAEQYSLVHVGAAVVHLTTNSVDAFSGDLPDGALLLLCLERVWRTLYSAESITDVAVVNRTIDVLRGLHKERRLFSHWRFQLQAA